MTSRSSRALFLITPLLAGAVLILVSVLERSATLIHSWPWTFYVQLAMVVPVALLGVKLLRRSGPTSPAEKFLLAIALAIGIAVAFSPFPEFSAQVALLLWSGLCLTALLVRHLPKLISNPAGGGSPTRNLRLIGAVLLLPILASLLLWLRDRSIDVDQRGWSVVLSHLFHYRNPHPFGHWNYTAGYALLVAPWMLALAWVDRSRFRPLWALAALLAIAVLISSTSRGAVLALAALVALGVLHVLFWQKNRVVRVVILAAAIVGLLLLFLTNPRLREFSNQAGSTFHPSEGDVQRLGMLHGGWLLWKQSPWIGHGPGTTPFLYPGIRQHLLGGVETSYQLHCAPLQVTVDTGLLGVIALGALLILAAWRARLLLRRGDPTLPRHSRVLALASAYSLVGYGVFSLTDYQLNVPAIVAALALHTAWVLVGANASPAQPRALVRTAPRVGGIVLLIGTVAMLAFLSVEWRARQAFWTAWGATPADDTQAVLTALHRAVEIAPRNSFYRTMLGVELAAASQTMKDEKAAATLQELARQQLQVSLQIDANQEPAHAALGWLLLSSHPARAEQHFRSAIRLIPDRETLNLGVAMVRLTQGDAASAVEALAWECLLHPAFLASPLWRESNLAPLRAATWERFNRLWTAASEHPGTPAWRRDELRYVRAWAEWWETGEIPTEEEIAHASAEQRTFFNELRRSSTDATPLPRELPEALACLWNAYRHPEHAESELAACRPALTEEAQRVALDRLSFEPKSFGELLRASPAEGVNVSQPIRRLHYNIMYRNLDGPGILDLSPRISDLFVKEFVSPLFPARGLVPAPVILSLQQRPDSR